MISTVTSSRYALRFLYDKSTMEYLYYKRKVAELRKDLLGPERASENGKLIIFSFGHILPAKHT